ncbi:hypothetical protein [Streptomyces sp. NPDC056160]|uniref:hypothetical protein n=1 Tax=Streptomyces sp. NPDC056160 TaxID=3345731 RepID=UPI0035D632EA
MPTSIAHTTGVRGGKTAVEVERDDLRDLLAVIHDALDLPPGIRRPVLLDGRVLLVLGTLRDVLTGKVTPPLISFEIELLRRNIAEAQSEGGDRHA